jgi:hypothetical protein
MRGVEECDARIRLTPSRVAIIRAGLGEEENVARAYELEPREVDLVVEALTLYRDRRAEYVPGMRQKEEASPTQITPDEAIDVVQRCNALISRLSDA